MSGEEEFVSDDRSDCGGRGRGHTFETDDAPHDGIDFPHVHIRVVLADRIFRLEACKPDGE